MLTSSLLIHRKQVELSNSNNIIHFPSTYTVPNVIWVTEWDCTAVSTSLFHSSLVVRICFLLLSSFKKILIFERIKRKP